MGKIFFWLVGAFLVLAVVNYFLERKYPTPKVKKKQAAGARVELSMETTEVPDYPYSIKGINFCGLDDSYLGDFEGTARALKADKYDPFAIGVYIGSKRVGWLPKGNAELHGHILEAGGSVPCEGWISKGNDASHSFYYGRVDVLI